MIDRLTFGCILYLYLYLYCSPFAKVTIVTVSDEKMMRLYEAAANNELNEKHGSANSAAAHRVRMGYV